MLKRALKIVFPIRPCVFYGRIYLLVGMTRVELAVSPSRTVWLTIGLHPENVRLSELSMRIWGRSHHVLWSGYKDSNLGLLRPKRATQIGRSGGI